MRGVPFGSRWANILFVLLIQPNNIRVNQRGRAIVSETTMWLVAVKIYGSNPMRFLIANIQIRLRINLVIPRVKVQFNKFLNSKWRLIKINFIVVK